MTVASQVKQCLSSLKGIEASLGAFALKSEDEEARKVFHETCLQTRRVIADIENRVGEMEREEPQYKGF
ncbi:DUF1657 domain-containing protein [Desertibacillus haloalkaliphilus]|uniref:DUF1657 domain-containing protein n=1 Tax=Desertibacillus haloalkaliphilus TaxID=1328930 RepID=UPI001C272D61|nr:DUF1657 domain-containing protein [Desertibacillus haloalkaliphilus]MBU8907168.1 DUF1657 domain-containing protein [Desertibacillus haloalkaliphilus]